MRALFITKPFFIEPLGIMYLVAAAKAAGHQADIAIADDLIETKIPMYDPDVLCYSIMTGDQNYYDKLNKRLKKLYGLPSLVGGPHPTFFPEMMDETSFDHICIGEGEAFFADFLNEVTKTNEHNLIEDLDTIPFADRDCVFKYDKINRGPIKHFIASRGCPYDCSYCFNRAYSDLYKGRGRRVRFRTVDNVLKEVKEVIESSPTEFVYFQDDTFILRPSWIKEFADKYPRITNLPFHCHTRANLVTEDIVKDLARAGCYSVHIAAETGNEAIRERLLNRTMSDDTIVNAVELFRKYGIKTMLQNILGLPGTTIKNDFETLELNIRCQPDYAWASIFQPYPKTYLGRYSQEIGEYTGDFSDLGSSFFDVSPLNFSHKNEVANLQKLFAFAVQNPVIYESGLLHVLIYLPYEQMKDRYCNLYRALRKQSDKTLYGIEL